MKRTIFSLLVIFSLLCGCRITKQSAPSYESLNTMELLQVDTLNMNQIDSVIVADSLMIFDKWHKNILYNDDDRTKIEQRLFIKNCKDGSTINYMTTYSEATNKLYIFKKIKYNE